MVNWHNDMKKAYYKIFWVVLFFSSPAFPAEHIVIDELQIIDNSLCASYHINELLDEKSIDALKRGIKSEVVHNLQLWRRKGLINPVEVEKNHWIKIFWDNWEKKYRLETEDENRLTHSIETVKQKCTFVENYAIANLDDLEKNQKYHLSIDVTFQLISAESYNAISDIFSGDSKTTKEQEKRKSGFVSVLVNLLGFGDKDFSFKTKDFIINDQNKVEYVQ